MLLDFARGIVVITVAGLALAGRVQNWHLYLMSTLVAAGFWMFWPTINALIQELTPSSDYVGSNSFLLASVQGGWLIAGAVVGFIYNHIGLGWILVIDFSTYVVSFLCYFLVRRGRVVVKPAHGSEHVHELEHAAATAWQKFWHELREGFLYVWQRPRLMLLGSSWALFLGAMLSQGVVTAPLSDRVLKAGAVGYGWLNGGWGTGAFFSVLYSPQFIRRWKPRLSAALSLSVLALALFLLPFSGWLLVAVALYIVMGSARGVGGTAINSEIMETVPKHFMGRVQNSFYFLGTLLQLGLSMAIAAVAHRVSLTAAFAIIGVIYLLSCIFAAWPETQRAEIAATAAAE
jgi:MFS family permease